MTNPTNDATIKLTDLEYRVMDAIAHSQYTPVNGTTPKTRDEMASVWFWPDEIASEIGETKHVVAGALGSLTQKEAISTYLVSAEERRRGDDSHIDFSDIGFDAWRAARDKRESDARAAALAAAGGAKTFVIAKHGPMDWSLSIDNRPVDDFCNETDALIFAKYLRKIGHRVEIK